MVTVNLDNEQLELIQEGLRLLKINCIEEIYTQQANELNYTKV